MTPTRRTVLAAGAAAPAAARAQPAFTAPAPSRHWRRIATEEAFWTSRLAAANGTLGQTLWDQPDMPIVRWTTDPADATYRKLISFEGERLRIMDEDGVAMHVLSVTVPGVQLLSRRSPPASRAKPTLRREASEAGEAVGPAPHDIGQDVDD